MRRNLVIAAAALAVSIMTPAVQAAPIFDNVAVVNDASLSDADFPIFVADDFRLSSGANTISGVQWTGLYAISNTPPAIDNFTLQIYRDDGGSPALGALETIVVGNAVNRAGTGRVIFGFDLYSYSSNVAPLTLPADTPYWISVFNDTTADTNDDWYWGMQIGAGNSVFRPDTTGAWEHANDAQDFQLIGAAVAVPEPGVLALLGIAIAGLGFARRSRLH